jgi:hypothetical protein
MRDGRLIEPGHRAGLPGWSRPGGTCIARGVLFEAGNCSRHAPAGDTLRLLLAARRICLEAFLYRRGRYQVGRAKLVAGPRASWPHWPEPAGCHCWHPRPFAGGARHLALAAAGASGKYHPPPAVQIRIPYLAKPEANEGKSNRGIRGIRGIRGKALLAFLLSAYFAYSAVTNCSHSACNSKEDEAK